MASGSTQTKKLPLAGGWNEAVLNKLPPNTVLEPVMNTEKRKIWENQVMFPYTIADRTCAFGGPLPNSKSKSAAILSIFPVYEPCKPRAFIDSPYNFNFIKPPNKVFRSAPYYGNEEYTKWLDRVQVSYGDFWKDAGIFELIQLSRVGPKYHQEMLVAALHFFESSTNTFHFECGMMTPTLFDVSTITGLSPLGETYDPAKTSASIEFAPKEKTFLKYIQENHAVGEEEVSDVEHVAFLTLWLSHYIFCSKSLQVAKHFIPMAIQLHEGRQFGLGRLILGCLFASMQLASENLKKTGDGSTFLAAGPFWLLQLWLNATFEKELELYLPGDYEEEARKRQIEGTRLARLVPLPLGLNYEQSFLKYFNIFLSLKTFKEGYAPFIKRIVGPSWFVQPFPPLQEFEEFGLAQWLAYLDPTVLSCRIGTAPKDFGLVGYFPHLVSRQFGLTQLTPQSFYEGAEDICIGHKIISEKYYKSYLKNTEKHKYELTPFEYQNSTASTKEFQDWWERHYSASIPSENFLLARISNGFNSSLSEHLRAPTAKGSKSKAASTSSQQSASLPVKEAKKGSKRTDSSITEKPTKKSRKDKVILTEIDEQNIDADIGRVIAKVSSQANPTTSAKGPEHKKDKKKDKQSAQDVVTKHKDDINQGPSVEILAIDPSKDKKKKKKKSKKIHSSTTSTTPEISTHQEQIGSAHVISDTEPQGTNKGTTQNVLQNKTLDHNNESSNSCLQPPPVMIPVSTIPETSEGKHGKEALINEHVSKEVIHEEKSTADSPQKGNQEENHQASPRHETDDQSKEDAPKGNEAGNEDGSRDKDQLEPNLNVEPQQQGPEPATHEHISSQRSPTPEQTNMDQFSESGNEDDLSAQPRGSSIDPQSSTSKISAAAGIPEALLQGLDVSTPEEALEKLLSSGSFNTNSEGTSMPTPNEEAARLEQAQLEARFIEEFLQWDVLEVIDNDPHAFFSLKSLLQQLQTDRTKEAMLFLVNQVEALIEQFAKNQQMLIHAQQSYQAQMQAHASALADATVCNAEVSNLKAGVTAAYLKTAACEENIARWRAEIRELESKIAEEQRLQEHYFKLATEVTPAQIEAKANEGLRLCSDAATLQATAQRFDRESNLLKIKLSQLKEVYRTFQRNAISNL